MLKPEDVAAYLKSNPAFFDTHGELFAGGSQIPTPTPFHERQLKVLRQRHQAQVAKYDQVVDSARNNQNLEQSLHELTLALLCAATQDAETGCAILCDQFHLDGARVVSAQHFRQSKALANVLESLQNRVAHGSSTCDDRVSKELLGTLFGDQQQIGSCAFVPLNFTNPLSSDDQEGVLVLGTEDVERFQPGMGSIYLDRVGQLMAAFLSVS